MELAKTTLDKCKREIVVKYLGIQQYSLKHSDFVRLSEEIKSETGVLISVSTLRRFFDDNYSGLPQMSTLDAFAKYLGYKNWTDYNKQENTKHKAARPKKTIRIRTTQQTTSIIGFVIIIIMVSVIVYFFVFPQKPDYSKAVFSLAPFDSTQMPVTVVYHYNLKNTQCDSAEIWPLGWGGDRFKVDLNDTVAAYTYTWPERFEPKLVINDSTIISHTIQLYTNGWRAAISNYQETFYVKYFDQEEVYHGGSMNITKELLARNNISLRDIDLTAFNNFGNFQKINGDSFNLESRVRNTLLTRTEKSGSLNLTVYFDHDFLTLNIVLENNPFVKQNMKIFEKTFSNDKSDLSFLQANLEKWQNINIKTENKHFYLTLGESVVYETEFTTSPGKFYGIRYLFNGLGEIDYVKVTNANGEKIIDDNFE